MKLYKKYYKQLPFTLYIYANTFTQDLKDEYFDNWKKLPYVELYDNADKKDKYVKMGEVLVSPEGYKRGVQGKFEVPDGIWSEAFLNFETPYGATVDADFEILNPKFIIRMIDKLDSNDNLVAMSTDYSPTQDYLGAYDLFERYHTWFCIYKKKAQVCKVSHFFYGETDENGKIILGYDCAAYFQKHLREDFGFDMDVIYIKKFRNLAIASKIGEGVPALCPFDRFSNYINRKIQKHAAKEFNKCFSDSVEDRKYIDTHILNNKDSKYDKFRDENNTKV